MTSEEDFQQNLHVFNQYSKTWKVNINFDKTKILLFGARNDGRYELFVLVHVYGSALYVGI